MMLNVMGNVHDKAPTRKKEDRHKQEEAHRKFQGTKTAPYGEHNFTDKEGGVWECTRCNNCPLYTAEAADE